VRLQSTVERGSAFTTCGLTTDKKKGISTSGGRRGKKSTPFYTFRSRKKERETLNLTFVGERGDGFWVPTDFVRGR